MNFIQTIPKKFLITILALLLIILGIWHVATTYSIINIKVHLHDNIQSDKKIYAIKGNTEDQLITPLFGDSYIINRQTTALKVTADKYATIKEVSSHSLSDSITVNIYRDKNAIKYSDSSFDCITYSQDADRLLSYSCTQPKQLIEYKSIGNSSAGNTNIATISEQDMNVYSLKSYLGGVIGIQIPKFHTIQTNQFIFMISQDGKKTTGNVPDNIDQSQLDGMNILTNSTSDSSGFALTSKSAGKIFFSDTNPQQITTYKEYTLPDNFLGESDTLICTLVDTIVFCYYGPSSHPHDDLENPNHTVKERDGTLLSIDFTGDTPLAEKYIIDKKSPVDMLFATQNKQLYAMSKEKFSHIRLHETHATVEPYINNPGSVSVGNGLVFIRDNAVYKYDDSTKESYLLFQSPKLNLSSVTEVNNTVFVNAYTKNNSGNRIHTYKITDEPNTSSDLRLIDILPLDFDASPDISDMSFYKNNLYIRVKMTVNKTVGAGRINQQEFEQAKQRIIEVLEKNAVDTGSLNIHFMY